MENNMKKKLLILIIAMSVIIPFDQTETMGQTPSKAVVYYFHGQFRCPSCLRIEEFTRKALQKAFAKELTSGAIVFQPVNIDVPKNEHYNTDYRLTTRSVIISKTNDGKETGWKNLSKVWDYLGDEKAFMNYVIKEVKDFIR